jgi:hypothetical protein
MRLIEATFSNQHLYEKQYIPNNSKEYANCLILKVCEFIKRYQEELNLSQEDADQVHDILGHPWSQFIDQIIKDCPNKQLTDKDCLKRLNSYYANFMFNFPVDSLTCSKIEGLIKKMPYLLIVDNELSVDSTGICSQGMMIKFSGGKIENPKIQAIFQGKLKKLGITPAISYSKLYCIARFMMNKLKSVKNTTSSGPHSPVLFRRVLINDPINDSKVDTPPDSSPLISKDQGVKSNCCCFCFC